LHIYIECRYKYAPVECLDPVERLIRIAASAEPESAPRGLPNTMPYAPGEEGGAERWFHRSACFCEITGSKDRKRDGRFDDKGAGLGE
jgi:hypothetical protein